MGQSSTRRFWLPPEVAAEARIPLAGVYRMIARGELKAIRLGRLLRIADGEVQKLFGGESNGTAQAQDG